MTNQFRNKTLSINAINKYKTYGSIIQMRKKCIQKHFNFYEILNSQYKLT